MQFLSFFGVMEVFFQKKRIFQARAGILSQKRKKAINGVQINTHENEVLSMEIPFMVWAKLEVLILECMLLGKKESCNKMIFVALVWVKKNLLTCHHFNSWDSYPDQRYDIANGVTIPKEIHVAFHKESGAAKNTKEQFEKFFHKRYQIFDYPWQNDNHEPFLSVEEIFARRASQQERHAEEIFSLIDSCGHVLVYEDGFSLKSPMEIYCPRHDTFHHVTVKKYKYWKTGLCCCDRQAQSDKGSWEHVNKVRREAKKKAQEGEGLEDFSFFISSTKAGAETPLHFQILFEGLRCSHSNLALSFCI